MPLFLPLNHGIGGNGGGRGLDKILAKPAFGGFLAFRGTCRALLGWTAERLLLGPGNTRSLDFARDDRVGWRLTDDRVGWRLTHDRVGRRLTDDRVGWRLTHDRVGGGVTD